MEYNVERASNSEFQVGILGLFLEPTKKDRRATFLFK
jgi:hypothetical protein